MANPCMFYGIPCEAGTEGDCVCRKRFFSSPRPLASVVRESPEAQAVEANRCEHGVWMADRCYKCDPPSQGDTAAEPKR